MGVGWWCGAGRRGPVASVLAVESARIFESQILTRHLRQVVSFLSERLCANNAWRIHDELIRTHVRHFSIE
ncbi:hypothetical protein PoB_004217500 [Plakobranchus ocellatus]|uniref:Uncharacterized protein n=1 Tax=Plakobranchus ocellatus TaxID=259542 RepID=A0AAV4B516_9GAST|nr:hypothetical protein PoB_004217500 [Plakobranchus ocellatus]